MAKKKTKNGRLLKDFLICKNIRHLRIIHEKTQEWLGKSVGISRSRIGSYEEFRAVPSPLLIVKFSNLFLISIDSLMRYDLTRISKLSLLNHIESSKSIENTLLMPISISQNVKILKILIL
jgi:DNA-binding XRE family transcriptional regulator